jgi:hypothetical protein
LLRSHGTWRDTELSFQPEKRVTIFAARASALFDQFQESYPARDSSSAWRTSPCRDSRVYDWPLSPGGQRSDPPREMSSRIAPSTSMPLLVHAGLIGVAVDVEHAQVSGSLPNGRKPA